MPNITVITLQLFMLANVRKSLKEFKLYLKQNLLKIKKYIYIIADNPKAMIKGLNSSNYVGLPPRSTLFIID